MNHHPTCTEFILRGTRMSETLNHHPPSGCWDVLLSGPKVSTSWRSSRKPGLLMETLVRMFLKSASHLFVGKLQLQRLNIFHSIGVFSHYQHFYRPISHQVLFFLSLLVPMLLSSLSSLVQILPFDCKTFSEKCHGSCFVSVFIGFPL